MKKVFLKACCFLLVSILLITNLPMAFAAPADYGSINLSMENPHFSGMDLPEEPVLYASLLMSNDTAEDYLTNPAEAVDLIREGMEERSAEITVKFTVDDTPPTDAAGRKEWLTELGFGLVDLALEETENPTEGDFLRYSYIRMSISAHYTIYSDHTDLILNYHPTYFTTALQDQELTAAVDDLVASFGFTEQTTERQKADTIYKWLCDNITYDNIHSNSYLLKFSAYAALVHRTAVCEGYAVLFYRLAEEVGLDARVVTGYAIHSGEAHAWNIVRLGGNYYYLDSTWDAGSTPAYYRYYLKGESDFEGHINNADFDAAEFRARYPIALEAMPAPSGVPCLECDWQIKGDGWHHWYECSVCKEHKGTASHSGGTATCKDLAACTICNTPYGGFADHQWSNPCDTACNICGLTRQVAGHQYDNDCDASCNLCAAPRKVGNHVYYNQCDTTCNICSATRSITHKYAAATCTKAKTCTICGAISGKALGHSYKAATCTKAKTCTRCGITSGSKLGHKYTNACDKSCNICKATRTIKHTYKKVITKATLTKNGKIQNKCSVCGYVSSKVTAVRRAKSFKLSTSAYTYSGKTKTPGVTVKDTAGKVLKKGTDYVVTYSSGRKNVGTYKVKITFKGKYSGSKTLSFTIKPKAASINKLTAKKKALNVKLNRSLKQSTGYQIQYSTTKNFKSYKTKAVTGYKTSTVTLKGLKAKKTYYVRVRTYKTVSGKKYYSNWSTAKKMKTK